MEEKSYAQSLKTGLEDAVAFINGDTSRGRVVVRKVQAPVYKAEDVVRTRKALNLTQSSLAFAMGVSTRTVEAWEAGRNIPSGLACRMLYLLDSDHSLLDRLTALR